MLMALLFSSPQLPYLKSAVNPLPPLSERLRSAINDDRMKKLPMLEKGVHK
jgi:hypothetical protein